jgi:hypothetical protein
MLRLVYQGAEGGMILTMKVMLLADVLERRGMIPMMMMMMRAETMD